MYIYIVKIPTSIFIPTFITLDTYLFCVCMRTAKFYSLSKLQLYNTELSTVVTMLYIISSDLIHLIPQSLYSHLPTLPYFPHPSSPWLPRFYSLPLWVWLFFSVQREIQSFYCLCKYVKVFSLIFIFIPVSV